MRHRKKGKKIGRKKGHRKQTLAALSRSLIENKRIRTTLAKAKALRPFVEPLITRAKEDTDHNRRQVFRHLQDKQAVAELFNEVSDRVGDRPGGYTRIIKLGRRSGDGAQLAMIELVDYNDVPPSTPGGDGSRTRRGSGKGSRDEASEPSDAQEEPSGEVDTVEEEPAEAEPADEAVEEEPAEEESSDEETEPAAEAEEETDSESAEEAADGDEEKRDS